MKTVLANSSVVVLCVVALGLACPDDGLADFDLKSAVGVWLLDEEEGVVAEDWTGNGNDGNLMVNTERVDGRFGGGVKVNGANQFVWIKGPEGLPIQSEPRTMMCYFKWTSTWPAPADRKTPGDRQGGIAVLSYGKTAFNGRVTIWLDDHEAVGSCTSFDTVLAPWAGDQEWHHAAIVYPPDAGGKTTEFLVYFDGKLQETRTEVVFGAANDLQTLAGDVTIGALVGSIDRFFTGTIDDAAIFPFAMDAENILSVKQRGLLRGQVLDVSPAGKLATSWGAIKER